MEVPNTVGGVGRGRALLREVKYPRAVTRPERAQLTELPSLHHVDRVGQRGPCLGLGWNDGAGRAGPRSARGEH
jgi:hypothetical protein